MKSLVDSNTVLLKMKQLLWSMYIHNDYYFFLRTATVFYHNKRNNESKQTCLASLTHKLDYKTNYNENVV